MSLLTPSESHAFFVDYHQDHHQAQSHQNIHHGQNQSPAWQMYDQSPNAHNDALAKATKDLMSLDADSWASSPQMNQQNTAPTHYNYYSQPQQAYHGQSSQIPSQHLPQRQQPRRNVTFPFLAKKEHNSGVQQVHHHSQLMPIAISPVPSYNSPADPRSASSIQSFQLPTPTTSSSSNGSFTYLNTPPSPTSPTQPIRSSRSPKRSLDAGPMGSNKRHRPSGPVHSNTMPSYTRLSASPVLPSLPPAMTSSSKPALLSPSQKKANHIQSEQKRRANIRRGYEALCETVPALREAIRLEEEAISQGKDAKSVRGKRGKGRGKDESAGEKIDGRAGPRSENVVLLKTIDYINDLHSERSELMGRLDRARLSLPAGHPALLSSPHPALWEREWKGGEAKDDEEDGPEDEDDS